MKKIVLLGLCLLSFQISAAGDIWCGGKLTNVYITAYGDVIINGTWRSEFTAICNIKKPNIVDITTCSLWASYAATAVKDKLNVTLMYSNTEHQCTSLPGYGASPTPVYFMLNATN